MAGRVSANPSERRTSLIEASDASLTHSGEPEEAARRVGRRIGRRGLLVIGAVSRVQMDELHLAVRVGLLEDLLQVAARGILRNVQLLGGIGQ